MVASGTSSSRDEMNERMNAVLGRELHRARLYYHAHAVAQVVLGGPPQPSRGPCPCGCLCDDRNVSCVPTRKRDTREVRIVDRHSLIGSSSYKY
jgi:hypothetical protein